MSRPAEKEGGGVRLRAAAVLAAEAGERRQASPVLVDEVGEPLPHLGRGLALPDAVRGDGAVRLADCRGDLLQRDGQGVSDSLEFGIGVQNCLTSAGDSATFLKSKIVRPGCERKSFGVSAGEMYA